MTANKSDIKHIQIKVLIERNKHSFKKKDKEENTPIFCCLTFIKLLVFYRLHGTTYSEKADSKEPFNKLSTA